MIMVKKKYLAPALKEIEIKQSQFLCGSGVTGPNGTGYGGVDTGGTKDPSSRRYSGWDNDEDEEDI